MGQGPFFTTLCRCMLVPLIAMLPHLVLADNLIDRRVARDTNGIWSQFDRVEKALLVASLGGALWSGREDRLGRTFWQGAEAYFIAQGTSEVLKEVTGRERPRETNDPDRWFKSGRSFPSGHAAGTAALVTPFILEYAKDFPAIWALAAFPAYEMVARVKAQAPGKLMC